MSCERLVRLLLNYIREDFVKPNRSMTKQEFKVQSAIEWTLCELIERYLNPANYDKTPLEITNDFVLKTEYYKIYSHNKEPYDIFDTANDIACAIGAYLQNIETKG